MAQLNDQDSQSPPVWAIFGDLMSGLVGVFVLLLIWVLGFQLELSKTLEEEVAKRQASEQRRLALETALADPLASGRVLFSLNSAELQPQGRELLHTLVTPLQVYLGERNEMLMVSGFTDDLPIQQGNNRFDDNWELSAQRALTVTRALIEQGMPANMVFAAAFGAQQPVASNSDKDGRSKNRRVEMAPVPKNSDHVAAQ